MEVTKIVTRQKKSFARAEVLKALIEAHGSVSHAAAALGTAPATIHRRLQRDAELRRELDEALERVLGEARARARLLLLKALDALDEALDHPHRAPAATRALLEIVRATEPRADAVIESWPFADPEVAAQFRAALQSFGLRMAEWVVAETGRPRHEVLARYRELVHSIATDGLGSKETHKRQERMRLVRPLALEEGENERD